MKEASFKGDMPVGTIIVIIIGIIILIISSPLIFRVAGLTWTQIEEKLGLLSYSGIEKAIICSQYICKYIDYTKDKNGNYVGCPLQSSDFKDFCYGFLNDLGSYEEVCSLPSTFGLSSCDPQFPIVIEVSEDSQLKHFGGVEENKISEEDLKHRLGDNLRIAKPNPEIGFDFWSALNPLKVMDGIWKTLDSWSIIIIPIEFVSSYEEYDFKIGLNTIKVFSSVNLVPQKYYISSLKTSLFNIFGWEPGKRYYTFIGNNTPYITLNSYSSVNRKLDTDYSYRIEIEPEKSYSNNLIGYNYFIKLTWNLEASSEEAITGNCVYEMEFKLYNLTSKEVETQVSGINTGNTYDFNTNFGKISITVDNLDNSIYCVGGDFSLAYIPSTQYTCPPGRVC